MFLRFSSCTASSLVFCGTARSQDKETHQCLSIPAGSMEELELCQELLPAVLRLIPRSPAHIARRGCRVADVRPEAWTWSFSGACRHSPVADPARLGLSLLSLRDCDTSASASAYQHGDQARTRGVDTLYSSNASFHEFTSAESSHISSCEASWCAIL